MFSPRSPAPLCSLSSPETTPCPLPLSHTITTCLPLPSPLLPPCSEVAVAEVQVATSPTELFEVLFSPSSPTRNALMAKEVSARDSTGLRSQPGLRRWCLEMEPRLLPACPACCEPETCSQSMHSTLSTRHPYALSLPAPLTCPLRSPLTFKHLSTWSIKPCS